MEFCVCDSCMRRIHDLLQVLDEADIGLFSENQNNLKIVSKMDINRLASALEGAKRDREFRNRVYKAFNEPFVTPMYSMMLKVEEAAKAEVKGKIWKEEYQILEDTIKKLFGDLGFDKTPLELVHKAQEKIDGLEYHIEQLDKELKKAEDALKALRFDRDAIMTVSGLLPASESEDEEALMRALKIAARRMGDITDKLSEVRARKAGKL